MTQQHHHIGVVGISSALGAQLARRLLMQPDISIAGYYRSSGSERVEALRRECDLRRLRLRRWSAERSDCWRIAKDIVAGGNGSTTSTLIYCCGKWASGPAHDLTQKQIRAVTEVGLLAPMSLAAAALQAARMCSRSVRILIVCGLGGEKSAGANVSLYSGVTSALYAYVRSVGEEVAGTDTCCLAVALGLMNKGQAYIDHVCAQLPIARPYSVAAVADILEHMVLNADLRMYNGSVLELAGGLLSYRQLADIVR